MVPSTWVMWIMPSANLPQRCDNMAPLGRLKEEQELLKVFCSREIWLWFETRVQKGGVNDFEPWSFESFDTSIGSKYKHHLL